MTPNSLWRILGIGALGLCSCADATSTADVSVGARAAALAERPGEVLFDTALPHTNGRACGDCHVEEDHRVLTPEHVQALFVTDPGAPLFNRLDADDPSAANPTYDNLMHGLVRVVLPLPANMDVIDYAGNVVTNESRTIEVWRAVPTIENTSYTEGFQYDGRFATLEEQALGALTDHSELSRDLPSSLITLIADFERAQFSSDRARFVADQVDAGVPRDAIPNPEDDAAFLASLTDAQRRGKDVYDRACTGCHGGATDNVIVNRAAHASLCFLPGHDGNLILDFTDLNGNGVFDANPEFLTLVAQAPPEGCDEFLALGTSLGTTLGQMGIPTLTPAFNATAQLPQYRFRFYTDATRTEQVTDLPPLPAVNPDGTVMTDERGLPIFGPVGAPQLFTTDPGRAAITGRPQDFQAFDVPQLRGIANTAPYFHDNVAETLEDVIDLYSHTILPLVPAIGLLPVHPRPGSFFGAESLSTQEKADLLEFLKIF